MLEHRLSVEQLEHRHLVVGLSDRDGGFRTGLLGFGRLQHGRGGLICRQGVITDSLCHRCTLDQGSFTLEVALGIVRFGPCALCMSFRRCPTGPCADHARSRSLQPGSGNGDPRIGAFKGRLRLSNAGFEGTGVESGHGLALGHAVVVADQNLRDLA